MLLYQDRLTSLLNVFALQAFVLSLSVAWQAYVQNAPHLYLTAGIALSVKAVIIPLALRRIIRRLGNHGEIATAIDRQRVVKGKSVAVSVDVGGRRIIKKKK